MDALGWLSDRPELALIPLAALAVAVATLLVARGSGRTARKSYLLGATQEERRLLALEVRLVEARCFVYRAGREYVFEVVIRNPSDRPNAIPEAELWIDYSLGDRSVLVKVPWRHISANSATSGRPEPDAGVADTSRLSLPISLPGNDAQVGKLTVWVPDQVLGSSHVHRVRLVLVDTFHRSSDVTSEIIIEQRVEDDRS